MGILQNKTALVTGSSSGIGKSIAALFAREGANVIITYHSGKDRAENLVNDLSGLNIKAKAYQVNISNYNETQNFFNLINKDFEDIDILVNNAGIKAGMRNLTRTLAIELAPKELTVNNIAPGMILTPINKQFTDEAKLLKEKEDIIPMKRGGTPEEVANVALFLASQASSYVTGATYTVDGALSILGQNA